MQRVDLEHIIRASAEIADDEAIVVIGSQAVLGARPQAPAQLLTSMDADVYPRTHPERADVIDGAIGEGSLFHETFGYYAHGVGPETATCPPGWEERLVAIANPNTKNATGLCLEPHDLVLSKCLAGRDKDWDFARIALAEGLVDLGQLLEGAERMPIADPYGLINRLRSLKAQLLLAIISDTHLPRGKRRLPDRCVELCASADLILHAGDIATAEVLQAIEAIGPPVRAVVGNVDDPDLYDALPEDLVVEVARMRIGMVHDAGPKSGRLERLRRRFPDADAVVFGHSHIPLHERDAQSGFQIFNPGSPTDRRRQPRHTMGLARVRAKELTFELLTLD